MAEKLIKVSIENMAIWMDPKEIFCIVEAKDDEVVHPLIYGDFGPINFMPHKKIAFYDAKKTYVEFIKFITPYIPRHIIAIDPEYDTEIFINKERIAAVVDSKSETKKINVFSKNGIQIVVKADIEAFLEKMNR